MNFASTIQNIASLFAAVRPKKSPLPWAAFLFFEGLSVYSTTIGVHAFYDGNWGWVPAALLAFFLHLVAVSFFLKFRQTKKLPLLIPYVLGFMIFVMYSWGWHWKDNRGNEVASQDFSGKLTELETALYAARTNYFVVAAKTNELASYSQDRANEEELHGGTCGDVSDKKRGKRWQIRMDDKQESASLAASARDRLAQVNGLLKKVEGVRGAPAGVVAASQDLDRFGTELSALASNDAVTADIRDRVQARLRLSHDGYDLPRYGLTRCPDPRRDSLLAGVLKAATMPAVTYVHVMDAQSASETQKRIWGRAANTFAVLYAEFWGTKLDAQTLADQLGFSDYLALAQASLIEILVLLSLTLIGRPKPADDIDVDSLRSDQNEMVFDAVLRVAEGIGGSAGAVLDMIEDHLWWPTVSDHPLLVVPMAPQESVVPGLYRIAELLVELDYAKIPRAHPIYSLRLRSRFWPGVPAHLRALAKSSTTVRLYRLDKHAYRRLTLGFALANADKAETKRPREESTDPDRDGDRGHQSKRPASANDFVKMLTRLSKVD
jgi:hypothetical protein